MSIPAPILRYERKFLADGLSLAETLNLVRRHRALFREVFPPRVINNVYLDSPGLQDYHDNVDGTAQRTKTRIRWYGAVNGVIEKPNLERKIKHGILSTKVTYPLPPLTINGHLDRHHLDEVLATLKTSGEIHRLLRGLQPALLNQYHRYYYLSWDNRFRLTVDSDLRFFSLRSGTGWGAPQVPVGAGIVLELKFDPSAADLADAITNTFPFRLSRCSKYVLGIGHLHFR